MPEWANLLISLACGIGGLMAGYSLGYRNGSTVGELRALHNTMSERRRRHGRRHRHEQADPEFQEPEDDDE